MRNLRDWHARTVHRRGVQYFFNMKGWNSMQHSTRSCVHPRPACLLGCCQDRAVRIFPVRTELPLTNASWRYPADRNQRLVPVSGIWHPGVHQWQLQCEHGLANCAILAAALQATSARVYTASCAVLHAVPWLQPFILKKLLNAASMDHACNRQHTKPCLSARDQPTLEAVARRQADDHRYPLSLLPVATGGGRRRLDGDSACAPNMTFDQHQLIPVILRGARSDQVHGIMHTPLYALQCISVTASPGALSVLTPTALDRWTDGGFFIDAYPVSRIQLDIRGQL